MNAYPASTEMGWGRGNAPFPSAPSPRTTLGRLHKTLDTPLDLPEPLSEVLRLPAVHGIRIHCSGANPFGSARICQLPPVVRYPNLTTLAFAVFQ